MARRPPQRPGRRAAQGRGAGGAGGAGRRATTGALSAGPAIARVRGPGAPSSLRTQGPSSPGLPAAGMAVGEPGAPLTRLGPPSAAPQVQRARPSRKPGAAAAGELAPSVRNARELSGTTGCRPRGGCSLIPSGCRSDGRFGSLKKKKTTLLQWRFSLNVIFRNTRPGVSLANH